MNLRADATQRYWLVGGVIWIFERILREVRSRHRTYIHKVIQHPSKVMELQIKKEKTKSRVWGFLGKKSGKGKEDKENEHPESVETSELAYR